MLGARELIGLGAVAGLLGCANLTSEPSCGRQRSVTAFDTLPNVAFDLTLVDVDPHGASYFLGGDAFSWEITVPEGKVSAVHLHLRDDGRMLWDLTTDDLNPDPGYTVAGGGDYSPTTDIANLFGLVQTGRTYIDVHTGGATQPVIRADVTQIHSEDWTDNVCST
jgi:hypothetical protein